MHQVVRFERTVLGPGYSGDEPYQGVGRDISMEGVSFLTSGPLFPGEVLRLHIPIETEHPAVPVLSEVRWARRVPEGVLVGLQFLA
jgi:hypothetical protein